MIAKLVLITLAIAAATAYNGNPDPSQLIYNDVLVLKYAETLENFEASFYNKFMPQFTAASFVAAGYDASVYAALVTIQAHENAHSSFLNATLASMRASGVVGASAVPICNYTFPEITTVQQFLNYSYIFESVGVSAYDGAASFLNNSALVQIAATIATIEGRHAGYLAGVVNSAPIPSGSTDLVRLPTTVAGVIAPYLGNCSYNVAANLPYQFTIVPVNPTSGTAVNPSSYQLTQNDIAALNYALYLEILEASFYNYGQSVFTDAMFTAAGYPTGTWANFQLIKEHENAHVTALTGAVQTLGGTPTSNCTYNFTGIIGTDINTYVAYAQILENTGVMAYDGALNTIYSNNYKTIAASIATIEARHAAYLNKLTNNATSNAPAFVSANATGNAYDNAASFSAITAAVASTKLVVSCGSNTLVAPTVVRLVSLNNATTTLGGTTRTLPTATGTSTGASTGTSTSANTGGATTSGASSVAVSVFAVATAFALLF